MYSSNLEGDVCEPMEKTAWMRWMEIFPRKLGEGEGEDEEAEVEAAEVVDRVVPPEELKEEALLSLFLRLWVLGWWKGIML
jgi:hypothetical protein